MKIKYSIFEQIEKSLVELRFKIILNKEDYILVMKFNDSFFRAIDINIDKDYIFNIEKNLLFEDKIFTGLYIHAVAKWGKDHIKKVEKVEERADGHNWETEEYCLICSNRGGLEHDKLVLLLKKNVERIMNSALKNKIEGDKSCHDEIIDIEYGKIAPE